MKKTFLLSALISLFSLTLSAQIKKGSVLLGGQISAYHSKTHPSVIQSEQELNTVNFNISVGKAIKDNAVLGVYGTYAHAKSDNFYNGNSNYNSKLDIYKLGVFYRNYKKLAKDFYFFGELGTGYMGSKQIDNNVQGNNPIRYTSTGAELYLTPGIAYRVFKKLQLELVIPQIAGMQYEVRKTTAQGSVFKQDMFQFNTNLNSSLLNNLGLGFRFVL
jgi:hypothetical protein